MDAFWILIFLIAVSSLFSLTEMALASARKARLQLMLEGGEARAATALAIKDHPSRFLAATQTGITAAALMAGIFGESAMKAALEQAVVQAAPPLAAYGDEISLALTIAIVTALSIVFGEIVPKRIAIAYPEQVAVRAAPLMQWFIRLLSPAIHFLSWLSDVVLRLLPLRSAPAVTGVEDILAYVDESERAGAIRPEESHLLGNVFRLEDRRVGAVMTPAADVVFIDLQQPRERNLTLLREAPYSRFPICKGGVQNAVGVAESRTLLQAALAGEIDFAETPMIPPLYVPSVLTLIDLLASFRTHRTTFAFVVNEFGQTEGIVTLDDLLETVVGDMSPTAADPDEALAVRRPDGSWLLDGLLPLDEMKEKLGVRTVPDEALGNYHTVGGFVLALLGHIPKKAERFAWDGWEFEVVDVDKNRVDQVLATATPDPAAPRPADASAP
ncbi:HlyC/CorC family transporter [Nitrogeniibacter mangrovi]|uniref:HlyC/CorC family transporter n=1 Tax=Nitrogeniibacter mangrovi TaxID=2016596 RepID=A0A6C1B7G5_9RHOO|nr:hemolysin family protein [Nitrogeniibacter mangrovi]QID19303.1 HlyC/CorC family transporter [Nitrogeniibacter mangrovi]